MKQFVVLCGFLIAIHSVSVRPVCAQGNEKLPQATPQESVAPKLWQLVDDIGAKPSNVPDIHSLTYCQKQEGQEKDACIAANSYGLSLYGSLSASHTQLTSMPSVEFSRSISALATARDVLWSKQVYGNLILANLINKLIFWRVCERISLSPDNEIQGLKDTLKYYRPLGQDWRTVIKASEKEAGIHITIKDEAGIRIVNSVYFDAVRQLEEQTKTEASRFGITKIAQSLKDADVGLFLSSFSVDGDRTELLNAYYEIRAKSNHFPPEIGQEYEVVPGPYPIISTPGAQWFKKNAPPILQVISGTSKQATSLKYNDLYLVFEQAHKLNGAKLMEFAYV